MRKNGMSGCSNAKEIFSRVINVLLFTLFLSGLQLIYVWSFLFALQKKAQS